MSCKYCDKTGKVKNALLASSTKQMVMELPSPCCQLKPYNHYAVYWRYANDLRLSEHEDVIIKRNIKRSNFPSGVVHCGIA